MADVGTPRRCAVLGQPIAHSLSPVLHRAAYAALELDWDYTAVQVGEAELADFVASLDGQMRGLSLTMPLKRSVLPLLQARDSWVDRSGVANTVVLEPGRRTGFNTDIPGAMTAISERLASTPATATVLGGGATAASVMLALAELGTERVTLAVRDPSRAEETVRTLASHPRAPYLDVVELEQAPQADLVVSTIPSDAVDGALLARLAGARAVFDVLYHPWPTRLAAAAHKQGAVVISGLDLLAHQAVLQVELFTGQELDVARRRVLTAAMHAAGVEELERRHG